MGLASGHGSDGIVHALGTVQDLTVIDAVERSLVRVADSKKR